MYSKCVALQVGAFRYVHPSYLCAGGALVLLPQLPGEPRKPGDHANRWATGLDATVPSVRTEGKYVCTYHMGTHIPATSMRDPRVSYLTLAKAL